MRTGFRCDRQIVPDSQNHLSEEAAVNRIGIVRAGAAISLVASGFLGGLAISSTLSGAASTGLTYFACLKGGLISHVQGTTHSCPATYSLISWNQRGIAGTPGTPVSYTHL